MHKYVRATFQGEKRANGGRLPCFSCATKNIVSGEGLCKWNGLQNLCVFLLLVLFFLILVMLFFLVCDGFNLINRRLPCGNWRGNKVSAVFVYSLRGANLGKVA